MREKPENMRKVTFIHSPNFDIIISMKSAFPALLPPDRQKRQTGAFTLVELLVVIVIIGILTAIIIPVTGRVRESARTVKCQSNLRQIGTAMLLNASENKIRSPSTTTVTISTGHMSCAPTLLIISQVPWGVVSIFFALRLMRSRESRMWPHLVTCGIQHSVV